MDLIRVLFVSDTHLGFDLPRRPRVTRRRRGPDFFANFEKAIEWSSKAVELGEAEDNEQLEQLQKELDSYKEGKPWREIQETEENAVPILSPEDLIDT